MHSMHEYLYGLYMSYLLHIRFSDVEEDSEEKSEEEGDSDAETGAKRRREDPARQRRDGGRNERENEYDYLHTCTLRCYISTKCVSLLVKFMHTLHVCICIHIYLE